MNIFKTLAALALLATPMALPAAWVCDNCTWVDENDGDWTLVPSDGPITEHAGLEGGLTYAQPLGGILYWSKITLSAKNLTVPNQHSHWAFALNDTPGSRLPYDGLASCAVEGIQVFGIFLVQDSTWSNWFCPIPTGPIYINFWATGPGAEDCGTLKSCAVKIIDGSAQ